MPGISSQSFSSPTPPITGQEVGIQDQAIAAPTPNPNVLSVHDYGAEGPGVDVAAINAALAPVPLLGATTAAMNLYVNPTTGSDSSPGTAAEPFRTIAAALAAVPQIIKHVVTINLADGDYNEAIAPTHRLACGTGVLIFIGNMKLITGEAERTATIFSASTIGTALAGWVVDALDEAWVTIISGAGAGQTRKIRNNTSDTITVTRNFNPVPDITSHYEIRSPSARILGYVTDWATQYYSVMLDNLGGSERQPVILRNLYLDRGLHIGGTTCFGGDALEIRKGLFVEHSSGYVMIGMTTYVAPDGTQPIDTREGYFIGEGTYNAISWIQNLRYSSIGYGVSKGNIGMNGGAVQFYQSIIRDGATTHGVYINGAREEAQTTFYDTILQGVTAVDMYASRVRFRGTMIGCAAGIRLAYDSFIRFISLAGTGSTGPLLTADKNCTAIFDNLGNMTATVVGGGLYKAGNRPVGTAWADLTTYGPDDDGADQKLVRAVPANPGPWTIATGVALNGMLASGLVRVHDLTAGAVLAEAAPAPGAGQFSVDYATGVITFNTAEQTHLVAIYYRPVSYTGARIG